MRQFFLTAVCGFTMGASLSAHASEMTSQQQLNDSLAKIEANDKTYKSVIALNSKTREDALAIDKGPNTLLKGMPILVKDNIDILGMPTTAGSLALNDNYPNSDATSIAQLKSAGALILGKTNLSEWANFRSEKSSSGWSAVGGQTVNASDTTRSPCGSSSGSAVAVALGYVKAAIGTETYGSIICPASSNGVVGFKPTHGIVSGDGIVPIALEQDTAGPLANSIENAALVLSAMIDPSSENAAELINGLQNLQQASPLKGKRVGILASTLGYDDRRDQQFTKIVETLKAEGVTIVNDISITAYDGFWDDNYVLLQYAFKRDLNAYFASRNNSLKTMTLAKLIQFNKDNAEQELVHFDQNIFEKAQALELSEEGYQSILKKGHSMARENGLDKVMAEHKLDAIIAISGGPAWKIDHINGDSFFGPGIAGYPAIGGHPHVTVPAGKISGMPFGVSFIGKRFQDHKLAQLVYLFKQL